MLALGVLEAFHGSNFNFGFFCSAFIKYKIDEII
jgi:hypothetical protein